MCRRSERSLPSDRLLQSDRTWGEYDPNNVPDGLFPAPGFLFGDPNAPYCMLGAVCVLELYNQLLSEGWYERKECGVLILICISVAFKISTRQLSQNRPSNS